MVFGFCSSKREENRRLFRIKIKRLKSNWKEKMFHQHRNEENCKRIFVKSSWKDVFLSLVLFVLLMRIVKMENIFPVLLEMKWLNG